jgi:hypothetical protein
MGNLDGFVILQQIGLVALKMALITIPPLMLIGFIDRALNFMPWSIPFRSPGHFLQTEQRRISGNQTHLLFEPERIAIEG